MFVVSAEEMRRADHVASAQLGIPSLELMERAGEAVARRAAGLVRGPGPVLVVSGPGNNGGDGLVAARKLRARGFRVGVVAPSLEFRGDAEVNYQRALAAGLEVRKWEGGDLPRAPVAVDSLLGTGLSGQVRSPYLEMIRALNDLAAGGSRVLSVDMPSGMEADSGLPLPEAVRAVGTITLGRLKLGLLNPEARQWSGTIWLDTLGIPALAVERAGCRLRMPLPDTIDGWLKRPEPLAHKGSMGHVMIVGGSSRYRGAPVLTALGALRAGAGLVTVASPCRGLDLPPEAMSVPLPRDMEGGAERWAHTRLGDSGGHIGAWVVGPGLGGGPGARRLALDLMGRLAAPGVMDADGLNALARCSASLKEARSSSRDRWLLTPHPGEMARLLGSTVGEVQGDRLGAALEAALLSGQVVMLKGAGTITASPEGDLWINPTGNPLLASGGTGDVLAGAAGAFLSRGLDPVKAGVVSAFLQGLAADALAARGLGPGVGAGRLAEWLPRASGWTGGGGELRLPEDHLLVTLKGGTDGYDTSPELGRG